MAEVIDSLLVRLGLEADEKDFREANSLFDSVKTSALQFGAVIGAGLGVQGLTFGFAQAKDELGKFAEVYGTTAQFVDSLGYALDQSGGSASDAIGTIQRMRDLLEQTEWGEVPTDAFRIPGVDPYVLQGVSSVAEAFERLSGATGNLEPEQARRFLSSLGFGSVGEVQLLTGMSGGFSSLIAEGESYARVTEEMTEQAAEFQRSLANLTKAADGLGNELSTLIVDDFAGPMQEAADYLRDNRSEIRDFVEKALPWLEATAVGVGTLVALQGGSSALRMLGPLARRGGPIAGVAALYQFHKENPDHLEQSGDAASESFRYNAHQFGKMMGWEWLQDQTGRTGPENDPYDESFAPGAPDMSAIAPAAGGVSVTDQRSFHIDARGATDPQAVEEAARRGTESAINKAAENSAREMRSIAE